MEDREYVIKNKYIKGVHIEGYTIENKEGKTKFIKSGDIIKLALSNKISNANAVLNTETGKYILEVNNGLDSIDTVYKLNNIMLTLQCRIIDADGHCIGYKAKDETGKSYRLTIENTWELALGQAITDVEAVIINGHKVIKSLNDFKLSELPKMDN